MKRTFTIFLACLAVLALAPHAEAKDGPRLPKFSLPKLKLPNLGLSKYSKVPDEVPHHLAPFSEFDLLVDCDGKPPKVVATKTVELKRQAFTQWEKHDCGIMMKGNYMRVTYQTFFSDGTSIVWDKEYRS